jgi:hypothetical protein
LVSLRPGLRDVLYRAWENASVNPVQPELKAVHALRLSVPLFGNNAPVKMALKTNTEESTKNDLPFIAQPDGDWSPSNEKRG